MPHHPDDTASKRRAQSPQPREDAARDWQDDIEQITGEPFHRSTFWLRVHPDDVVRVVREVVRGHKTGSIETEYRLRDSCGEYVVVRGRVYRVPDENGNPVWSGAVRRLVCPDREWCPPYLNLRHKN